MAGADRQLPVGALLYPSPPVELTSWPWPALPFIQLQRSTEDVNRLIADQCRVSLGPWWLFRRTPGGPATEVKGKFIRPGERYCLIGRPDLAPPDVAWCEQHPIAVEDVRAHNLEVPATLGDTDAAALISAGISVVSDVSIRPVGVVASSWDGEGAVEWLAGEPGLIGIHAEHAPDQCKLTIDSDPYFVPWSRGQTELLLALENLTVGSHAVIASLGAADGNGRIVEGRLLVTVRDPQIRPDEATEGEGLRLRTSPAKPSLPELWDGRATLEVDGPAGTKADLALVLRDSEGATLAAVKRQVSLPVTAEAWRKLIAKERIGADFRKVYDDADFGDVRLTRAGVGFASLTCERGFRGLRWVVSARHDGGYNARLIDRTDGDALKVDFFPTERPLVGEPQSAGVEFTGPPRGGLLRAISGEGVATQIIPPNPNELLHIGVVQPSVPAGTKSLAEVTRLLRHHRQWLDADLPAHPFGERERQRVLDTITSALVGMLAGQLWARVEQQIRASSMSDVDLDEVQPSVGESPRHRALAKEIGIRLWQWGTAEERANGFAAVVGPVALDSGIANASEAASFLLALASSPGELLDLEEGERTFLLRCVLTSPVLVRAARFAVIGTQDELLGGTA